jgi:hypothetical protein
LIKKFARDNRIKLTDIANYPGSAGYFAEVEVRGNTGQMIKTGYALLEHEHGPEILIPLASGLAAWLGPKVANEIAGEALKVAMDHLTKFMEEQWEKLIWGGVRIDHVEIHTKDKGEMKMRFSDFDSQQITCLIENFPTIFHLRECNDKCFNGLLF